MLDEGGRVLLGRRAIEPFLGCWDFPGGFVEEHEHPLDALRRELREETSLEIEPVEYVGVLMDWYGPPGHGARSTMNFFWSARVVSGEPRADDDVAELRWFDPRSLPSDQELAFSMTRDLLRRWLGHEHA